MNNDVAIFLDLDNVVIGAAEVNLTFEISLIMEAVREVTKGRIVLRRAYGDWRQNRTIPKQLATAGFELQSAVRLSHTSKNLADMQMVIDSMETLIDGHDFSTYVLVTGDRDFMPLVQALRKRGKRVVGIGLSHSSSKSLMDLCDEYILYEEVARHKGQTPIREVEDLLQRALNEQLAREDRVQASLVKEDMQNLSHGAFGKSPDGQKSFRKFLQQYPHLVSLQQENTTLYAMRPDQGKKTVKAPAAPTGRKWAEAELVELLEATRDDLLSDQPRIRASVFKEKMQLLSNHTFDEAHQGDESFRHFLDRYPDVVQAQPSGTTLYVSRTEPIEATEDLHLRYRSQLKKQGLRIVPHQIRLLVLKDLIEHLQANPDSRWKAVVDLLASAYQAQSLVNVSKSHIHDVIRLARRADVLDQLNNNRSLATVPLKLMLTGDRIYQDAVMHCDAAYLEAIAALPEPFDLDQAALALYDANSYTRYLKVVMSRVKMNLSNGSAG